MVVAVQPLLVATLLRDQVGVTPCGTMTRYSVPAAGLLREIVIRAPVCVMLDAVTAVIVGAAVAVSKNPESKNPLSKKLIASPRRQDQARALALRSSGPKCRSDQYMTTITRMRGANRSRVSGGRFYRVCDCQRGVCTGCGCVVATLNPCPGWLGRGVCISAGG